MAVCKGWRFPRPRAHGAEGWVVLCARAGGFRELVHTQRFSSLPGGMFWGMRRDIDQAAESVAAEQHGIITVRQLFELGADSGLIGRRVAAGRWKRVTPQTLRIGQIRWKGRAMAAVLSTPHSLLSGRSAALMHGLGPYRRVPIEVTAPFTANARGKGYVVRRCRHFDQLESMVVDAIPTMSPTEMVFDLARREPRLLVQRIVEEGIVARKLTVDELAENTARRSASRCPGWRPVSHILADLAGDPVPESELERRMVRVLEEARLHGVVRQASLPWREPGAGRVDFVFPEWNLIVEVDGRRWHTREQAFEEDRARDNAAAAAGWRVLRFTYRMVVDRPDECVEMIRRVARHAA